MPYASVPFTPVSMYLFVSSFTQLPMRRMSDMAIARTMLPAGMPEPSNVIVPPAGVSVPEYWMRFATGQAETSLPQSAAPHTRYRRDVS